MGVNLTRCRLSLNSDDCRETSMQFLRIGYVCSYTKPSLGDKGLPGLRKTGLFSRELGFAGLAVFVPFYSVFCAKQETRVFKEVWNGSQDVYESTAQIGPVLS